MGSGATRPRMAETYYRPVPQNWPIIHPQLMSISAGAFRLYWYLRTGPHSGQLRILCRLGVGALMDDLGASFDAVNDMLDELEANGLIERDQRLIFLPGIVGETGLNCPNQIVGAVRELATMPPSHLQRRCLDELRRYVADKIQQNSKGKRREKWSLAPLDIELPPVPANGSPNGLVNHSPNGLANDIGNREEKQSFSEEESGPGLSDPAPGRAVGGAPGQGTANDTDPKLRAALDAAIRATAPKGGGS